MSDNNNYYRAKAIEDAFNLIREYDVDRCIRATRRVCEAIDEKDNTRDSLKELHAETDYDPCLDKIMHLIMVYHGCRQFLSALYFVKGNSLQSDLWHQKHLLGSNRFFNKSNELNDDDTEID